MTYENRYPRPMFPDPYDFPTNESLGNLDDLDSHALDALDALGALGPLDLLAPHPYDDTDGDGDGDGDEPPRLSLEALAEIAKAYTGQVDMKSMPQVPATAPCRQPDARPDDWFHPLRNPEFAGYLPSDLDEIAAWLCEGCPVLFECLQWALDNPAQEGILGGTTARMRDEIRDASQPPPTST